MSDNYNINDHIRDSLAELDVQPMGSSFDAVMQKLEQKRKRRFFIIFFFGILMLSSTAVYFFNDSPASILAQDLKKETAPAFKTQPIDKPVSAKEIPALKTTPEKIPVKNMQTLSNIIINTLQKNTPSKEILKTPGTNTGINSSNSAANNADNTSNDNASEAELINAPVGNADNSIDPGLHEIVSPSVSQTPVSVADSFPAQNVSFSFLGPKQFILQDSALYNLNSSITSPLTNPKTERITKALKKKRGYSFFVGISATPQLSSYLYSENKNRRADYDNTSLLSNRYDAPPSFTDLYLKNKKEQNAFTFSYFLSLKLGVVIKNKWELWLAYGQQRYSYDEDFYTLTTPEKKPIVPSYPLGLRRGFAYVTNTNEVKYGTKNNFWYSTYSLQCNRLIKLRPSLRLKVGGGLNINKIRFADYAYVVSPDVYYANAEANDGKLFFISRTLYTLNLNTGVIKDLGRRFQLRVSPGVFYTPTSLFDKGYLITQKRYGIELECMLAFRLFSVY